MSQDEQKTDGSGIILFIFMSIFYLMYLTASNIVDIETMMTFGPTQYVLNILHVETSPYAVIDRDLMLYRTPNDLRSFKTIKKDTVVKIKGLYKKDYVTLHAIIYYHGNDLIYGYIKLPNSARRDGIFTNFPFVGDGIFKNDYMYNANYESLYRRAYFKSRTKLLDHFKSVIYVETNPEKMQTLVDKHDIVTIKMFSEPNHILYIYREDQVKLDDYIKNNFGTKLEKLIFQEDESYLEKN